MLWLQKIWRWYSIGHQINKRRFDLKMLKLYLEEINMELGKLTDQDKQNVIERDKLLQPLPGEAMEAKRERRDKRKELDQKLNRNIEAAQSHLNSRKFYGKKINDLQLVIWELIQRRQDIWKVK